MVDYIEWIQTPDNVSHLIGGVNFDGQILYGLGVIFNSTINVNATATINLANKIPNDGFDYQISFQLVVSSNVTSTSTPVILAAYAGTGTTGQAIMITRFNCNPYLKCEVCRSGNLIIKANDRALTLSNTGQVALNVVIYFKSFRRIGTNA